MEDNYFDAVTRSTNTSPTPKLDQQNDPTQKKKFLHIKQQLFNKDAPESHKQYTGTSLHYPITPKGSACADIDLDVKLFKDQQQLEEAQEDTLVP